MRSLAGKSWSLLPVLALLCAGAASAQEEATAFDISLPNPGARSLGFGGAFLQLVDDATAAFANPAGLVQLLEPELTFDLRVQGDQSDASRVGDLTISSLDELNAVGFLAFVYPWNKIALAVYRNGFANAALGTRIRGLAGNRAFDIRTSNEAVVESTGLSVAYRWSEDFSIGAGVARWDGDLSSVRQSILTGEGLVGPGEHRLTTIGTTDESDLSFNAGFLWRFADRWRLGGVYRGGPEFGQRSEARSGPSTVPLDQLPVSVREFPFLLPDVLGLGVAFKSRGGSLTLSFEWDMVRYSRLLDSLRSPNRGSFDLDDGHELHLGVEYVIVRSRPVLALRLGTWREPEHSLRYFGDDPIDRATFRGGEEQTHYAAGLGLAFRSLKLDLAFDQSDLANTGSFTLIYSF